MSDCLTEQELHRFHARELSPQSIERVKEHLDACGDCRQRDDDLVARHEDLIGAARAQFSTDMNTLTAADSTGDGHAPPPSVAIEGYELRRELGRGGQGVVYQAIQLATKSKVAIKVLLHGSYASESSKRRFEREIEMVAQLRHPNIITIFGSGQTKDDQPYYVMDYVRGVPLTDYIRHNNLTLQETLLLFGKVCDAVQFAHQRGVIHRDLKPSNVRVDAKGNPKLLDFGLARWATASGETLSQAVVGTLPYMAPEQTKGNPDIIDTRTDVYALGVVLYEMLTGHYPYPITENMAQTLRNIAEAIPTPPSRGWTSDSGITRRSDRRTKHGSCPIDDEVQTVVLKALSKEPERRYQSAGELGRDVRRYLDGHAIEAKRDSKLYLIRVSMRQHKGKYVTAALFAILVFAYGANYVHSVEERSLRQITELGMNRQWVGDYRDAIEKFDEVIAVDPDNFRALYQKAQCLRMLYLREQADFHNPRTLDDAIDLTLRASEIEPKESVFNLLGTLNHQAERYDAAERYLRQALSIRKTYFFANSNLAKTYAVQGQLDDALAETLLGIESAKADTNTDSIYKDGIWLTLATLQLHFGKPESLDSLQTAIDIDGEDYRSRLMLARYYLHPDFQDPARALEQAKNAHLLTRNEAEDSRVLRVLALAHLRNGDLASARDFAEQAARHGDENDQVYSDAIRAIVAARRGLLDDAESRLSRVDDNAPEFMEGGILVSIDREILWIDTEEELLAMREEAVSALNDR